MQKAIYRLGARIYLATYKRVLTWAFNAWYRWPRTSVRKFVTPEAAVAYYKDDKQNPYVLDPWGGVLDFDTPPECVQAALDAGTVLTTLWCDCDDVGAYLMAALHDPGRYELERVAVVDKWVAGSHVVTLGREIASGRCFMLDTNGLTELPDLTEDAVCAKLKDIYKAQGYDYIVTVAHS